MKYVGPVGICIAILAALTVSFACSDLLDILGGGSGTAGSDIDTATTPALLLYNTSYNTRDTQGQVIGNVPAVNIPAAAQSIRALSDGEDTPPLLKDLPWRENADQIVPGGLRAAAPGAQSSPQQRAPLSSANSYTFQAFNADEKIVEIQATKRGESAHCYVFVENGQEGNTNWQAIANYYEDYVWPKDTELFGVPYIVTTNSDKIVILYYKMKDNKDKEYPYILGFFYSRDLQTGGTIPKGEYSNGMNIFYLNLSFPGGPDHEEMVRTLFHEFQHMINYTRRILILNYSTRTDTWIDEGMAESAEHYGLGTYGASRVKAMNSDSKGRLANGCSLIVWGNDADDINYGLAYTFMQYLRLHSSAGWQIMPAIINNLNADYRALESVMSDNSELNTFAKMLGGYHTARFLNAPSGIYSFLGEKNNFKFTPRSPSDPINAKTKITAGGALYLPTNDRAALSAYSPSGAGPSGAGANIRAYPHLP